MKKLFLISTAVLALTVAQGQIAVTLTGTSPTCAGQCDGTATVVPTGGTPPFYYMWSPTGQTTQTITGLCAGTYSVTVTDANSATATGTITLTQPIVLNVFVSSISASCNGCCDGSAIGIVSGGTAPYTYQWFPNGATTANATGLCAGNYTLCVTDANGCYTCVIATITQPLLGLPELNSSISFSIYPNPFSTQTTLQIDPAQNGAGNLLHNATLTVYNCFGQTVKQYNNITGNSFTFFRDNLPSGLYFIRLSTPSPSGGGTQGGGEVTGKLVITD
ncbi:MAG: T9SS type A sorting domain-containing protein [Bacteroidetes bacterium]|nr:T9SS type A sorting domain-containing protein [Bacteroidota bacterium]